MSPPERNLVFDLTDFDETTTGCWEWDIKRLVTSFVLAAREFGLGRSYQQEIVHQVVSTYRENISVYEAFEPLQMWYQKIDAKSVFAHAKIRDSQARMEKSVAAAKSRTVEALLPRITRADPQNPAKRQFVEQPPTFSRNHEGEGFLAETERMIRAYVLTLSDGRSELFQRYSLSDAAMKVVGVGSVGLRCGVLLFEDSDGAPLVLQIKEARPSIFAASPTDLKTNHEGYRVVHGQRLVQAASDLFLGWTSDSKGRQYYLRQLRDMKLSIDLLHSDPQSLLDYGHLCGLALARAHAKSGKASYIAGYLGQGDQIDFALDAFGLAYADQVERDFLEFQKLVSSGTIPVEIA